MTQTQWKVKFRVFRQKGDEQPHFDEFDMQVNPDEYVLDVVERIWAFKDRSLCYRHACHHSTCGACGMRVNGVEKLTCITPVRDVTQDGGTVRVEPLRNFPVVSDLAVDMGWFYTRMDEVKAQAVLPVPEAEVENPPQEWPAETQQYIRLSDCIECGLCMSACPISITSSSYLGPAVLAGLQMHRPEEQLRLIDLADSDAGVWRCHSAFECTAVCPSFVDPGRRIMDLRKRVVGHRIRSLFGGK
ncbi:MAG: succinate dehydrogenase/fumarate reductase iron-sulfur subunit [Chloroflexota bacterium]